jgi:ABC-type phosphate/phosphonate transport system ATPase subunit
LTDCARERNFKTMLEVKGVTKSYGERLTALSNVSFELEKGEMAFLTGVSGAGKSTLLRLIFREELPTFGKINLGPYNLADLPKNKMPEFQADFGADGVRKRGPGPGGNRHVIPGDIEKGQ